ncbi:hypothetical protein D3C81_1696020 [compost metagenome]
MGKIAFGIHPVLERTFYTAAHRRVQLVNNLCIPGILNIVLQLDNKPRRPVGGVVVNILRCQDIRNSAVIFRSLIRVLVFGKRHENILSRFELPADQYRTWKSNELIASPVFIEPGQSGINPLALLSGYELIHG